MIESTPGNLPDIKIEIIPTPLSEVEPIKKSRALHFSPDKIKEFVEPPLVKACQILYEKHIETYESSANKESIELKYPDSALLTLNGDQLIPENWEIVQKMVRGGTLGYQVEVKDPRRYEPHFKTMVIFSVPMKKEITAEEIEEKSVDFANRFVPNVIKIEVPDEPEVKVIG